MFLNLWKRYYLLLEYTDGDGVENSDNDAAGQCLGAIIYHYFSFDDKLEF
jgi:hypothetical protein